MATAEHDLPCVRFKEWWLLVLGWRTVPGRLELSVRTDQMSSVLPANSICLVRVLQRDPYTPRHDADSLRDQGSP